MRRLAVLTVLICGGWLAQEMLAQEPAAETKSGSAEASSEPSALWKWVNFLMLAGGLGYFAAKGFPAFFRARTTEIQAGIEEARAFKMDAEQRASAISARISHLSEDIDKFRMQAQAEMEQEGVRIRQETAAHIEKLEKQAANEIEAAGMAARRELKTYAATLAMDLAEQQIRAGLDPRSIQALVDNFLKDLERQEARQ
jgi:F-type H+-transporting ATPase subunit b